MDSEYVAANRVFSGHCRIEAIADGGQALLLEGLRVHLDLQLEPEAVATAPAGSARGRPPYSTATQRVAPRRPSMAASTAPAYQKWAVLTALGSLLLALAIWWSGADLAQPDSGLTDSGLADTTANATREPEPAPAAAVPASVEPAGAGAAAAAAPVVVVPVLPPPPPTAPPAAAPQPQAAAASPPHAAAAKPGGRARSSGTSGAPKPPALAAERGSALNGNPRAARQPLSEEPRAATARLTDSDLLDLFGDTK